MSNPLGIENRVSNSHDDIELGLNAGKNNNPKGINQYTKGGVARFNGKAADGTVEGTMDVKIIEPHSNAHEVGHTDSKGRMYDKKGFVHVPTALVERPAQMFMGKERPAKQFHAFHHTLSQMTKNSDDVELAINCSGMKQCDKCAATANEGEQPTMGPVAKKPAAPHAKQAKAGSADAATRQEDYKNQVRVGNSIGGFSMTRSQLLSVLTANATPAQRAEIESLSNEALVAVANAMPAALAKAKDKKDDKDKDDDDDDDTVTERNAGKKSEGSNADDANAPGVAQAGGKGTPDEYPKYGTSNSRKELDAWEKTLPPAALAIWNSAKQVEFKERKAIVDRLTAHVTNADRKATLTNNLMAKTMPELHELVALIPPPVTRQVRMPEPIYTGAQGAGLTGNRGSSDDDVLDLPRMDLSDPNG